MFFKNSNIISKIKRSKVTDHAALNIKPKNEVDEHLGQPCLVNVMTISAETGSHFTTIPIKMQLKTNLLWSTST